MPPQLDVDITASALKVGRSLEQGRIPYAIGGAIALTMHGFARATRDVDLNLFCTPAELPAALELLKQTGLKFDPAVALREAEDEGWFTAWDGAVRIDLFVPSIDFSWEAMRSRVKLPFLGEQLWFLSAESLCVFKLLFFRTKDLADLEQLVLTSQLLDHGLVRTTIADLMGADDERVRAWDAIVSRFGTGRR